MVEIKDGIIDDNKKEYFNKNVKIDTASIFEYAIWENGLSKIISVAYLFAPKFVQIDECIFVHDLIVNNDYEEIDFIDDLRARFKTKKLIEQYANCVCIGDMFINDQEYLDDMNLVNMFIDCVIYFWTNRLKEVFPKRKFIFERGLDLNGDLGMCFTFYENTEPFIDIK